MTQIIYFCVILQNIIVKERNGADQFIQKYKTEHNVEVHQNQLNPCLMLKPKLNILSLFGLAWIGVPQPSLFLGVAAGYQITLNFCMSWYRALGWGCSQDWVSEC